MPDSRFPKLRHLAVLASAFVALILLISSSALASGPMPMDPEPVQHEPSSGSAGTGQSGTGSAGQPGGAGGQGSNSEPGQSAQQGGAAKAAPTAAVSAPTKKATAPAQSTRSAPARSSQPVRNTGGNIETIVQLPQPTAKLDPGPAPTGLSSGEPTDSLIEVASTAQPGTFPYATVALGLAVLALVVMLAPSFRGMPRPAVSSAADPV